MRVDDLLRSLGKRIRFLRSQKGWSQEVFADVCGVHRTYMGHLERGEKNLSFRSIVRIATALDVTLPRLLGDLDQAGPEGELGTVPMRSPKSGESRLQLDTNRMLKELEVLERATRALKEIALSRNAPPAPTTKKAAHSKRKRPN
jgi:transcriptional regulator with XRE-family HTH domain